MFFLHAAVCHCRHVVSLRAADNDAHCEFFSYPSDCKVNKKKFKVNIYFTYNLLHFLKMSIFVICVLQMRFLMMFC